MKVSKQNQNRYRSIGFAKESGLTVNCDRSPTSTRKTSGLGDYIIITDIILHPLKVYILSLKEYCLNSIFLHKKKRATFVALFIYFANPLTTRAESSSV